MIRIEILIALKRISFKISQKFSEFPSYLPWVNKGSLRL